MQRISILDKKFIGALLSAMIVLTGMPSAHAIPSTDATLQAMNTWSSGTLSAISPVFAPGTTAYTASASATTTSITVQPVATALANATIQIRINGGAYAAIASWGSATLNINTGTNTVETLVTAQDGVTTKLYSIAVTRAVAPSTDATLSSLALSSGTLSPTFAGATISYTSSTALSSITVTPTVHQTNATVQVKVNTGAFSSIASGSASGALALNIGAFNYIYVQVTAQDGSTVITYTITTTRLSTDSTLQSLALSWPGVLSPTFATATTAYSASVSSSTTSLTVTPAATDQSNATIQVRINSGTYTNVASWMASGALSLNVGANPIDIKVTAQDGVTVSTYTITVTRASPPSTDAKLSSLVLSAGSLTPTFAPTTYLYSANTNSASITVTPTANQINATIQVQANYAGYVVVSSAIASGPLALTVGSNSIDVKVTAQDGTTILTYTVTVTRLSADSTLQALNTWSSGSLSPIAPSFVAGTTSYIETTTATTTSMTVQPAAAQANAVIQIRINGGAYTTVASWGTYMPNLNYGANAIDVLVTAQDGTSNRTYSIVITRAPVAPAVVTAVASDTAATVSWAASVGATSYTATSSSGNFTCTSATSPCTITGLTNGTLYTFSVTATNSAGTSASSTASAGVRPIWILLTPTGVSAVAGDTSATVSWVASSGATSYTATSSPGNFTCTSATSPCTITGLTNETSYSFSVTASDGVSVTSASSSSNAIKPTSPLLAPTGLSAIAGNASIVISWTASIGATSYTATSSPGNLTCVSSVTWCTITGLTNGTPYTVSVTASNTWRSSTRSLSTPSLTPEAPPAPPLPNEASVESPVTQLFSASSSETTSLSASIPTNEVSSHVVSISVPAGALPTDLRFAIAPSISGSRSFARMFAIRVTATDSNGKRVTHFGRALILNLGHVESGTTVVFSQNGSDWVLIPRITGRRLPLNSQEGYFISVDGSTIVLTRHLTYFGVKKTQRALVTSSSETSLTVGEHTRVFVKGGSGIGDRSFNITSPGVCTITRGGYLRALSSGVCTIETRKIGDETYLDVSSLPLTLTIK